MPSQKTASSPPAAPKLPLWVQGIMQGHQELREKRAHDALQYTTPRLEKFCKDALKNGHREELTQSLLKDVAVVLLDGPAAEVAQAADTLATETLAKFTEPLAKFTEPSGDGKPFIKKIPLVTAAELAREQLSPPSMLVDKLWQKEGCGFFGGEPKTLKTYTALDMAIAIVTGGKVFDQFAVNETGPAILFLEETKRNEADQRIDQLCRGKRIDRSRLDDLHLSIQRRIQLNEPSFQEEIRWRCSEIKPVVCFFDHLGRMAPDAHYAAAEVNPVLDFLRSLQVDHSTAVVLVDHLNRPKNDKPERGASRLPGTVKYAWMDCGLFFTRPEGSDVVQVEGEHREARDPEPFTICRHESPTSNGTAVQLKYQAGRLLPEKARALADEQLQAAQEAGENGLTVRELRAIGKGGISDKTRATTYLLETGKLIKALGTRTDKTGRRHPAHRHYLPEHLPENAKPLDPDSV